MRTTTSLLTVSYRETGYLITVVGFYTLSLVSNFMEGFLFFDFGLPRGLR
jgi:hypothetical protein